MTKPWRPASDAVRDPAEQAVEVGTQRGDRENDDNGDEPDHETVLNSGGATVVAQSSGLDLKLDEARKHFSPLPGQ